MNLQDLDKIEIIVPGGPGSDNLGTPPAFDLGTPPKM